MMCVIMGVCGSGKTTIGQEVASMMQCGFMDGDAFHSLENIAKMKSGQPLTDDDRVPWLLNIHEYFKRCFREKKSVIISCSALKKCYRELLRHGSCQEDLPLQFIFLDGNKDIIEKRLQLRRDHFMPTDLLNSQFDALEKPEKAFEAVITCNVDRPVQDIVNFIVSNLPL